MQGFRIGVRLSTEGSSGEVVDDWEVILGVRSGALLKLLVREQICMQLLVGTTQGLSVYRVIHNSFTIRNENGGVSPSRPSRPFSSPCGTQRASPCIQIVLRVLSLLQGCHASSLRASASLNSAESFPWRAISKAAPMPDSVQPRSMVARSRANSSRASAQTRVHSGLSTSPYD